MRALGVPGMVGVALIAAGCGGAAAPPRDGAIHLDGKRAQGDYVFEADASGARFLVPAPVLAGQGGQAFDVSAPAEVTVGGPPTTATAAPPPYRIKGGVPSCYVAATASTTTLTRRLRLAIIDY